MSTVEMLPGRPESVMAWARMQVVLGTALKAEGERASGDEAVALLNQGVQAYEHALEVYTKADFSQQWAFIMRHLAQAHRDLGDIASADAESKAANEVDPQ